MRRFLALIVFASAVTLTGAGHRGPAPSPTPSPTPTASPTPLVPVVMIYPFTVNGDADKKAGQKLAELFLAEMATTGGIIVRPLPTAPVDRSTYLADSTKNGADYYISGYLTPLGDEVALVEQVVSTSSGAIIWASTAQVLTYGDAISQADTIRKVVMQHSGRVEASYQQQQAQATPPPGPDQQGASTSIGAILGLIKHVTGGGKHATPAPTNAPDKKPLHAIIVLGRDETSNMLEHSLDRIYRVSSAAPSGATVAESAKKICATFSNVTLAVADLQKELTKSLPAYTINSFTLKMYTCSGSSFFSKTVRSRSLQDAVDQAVSAYVAAHPNNS